MRPFLSGIDVLCNLSSYLEGSLTDGQIDNLAKFMPSPVGDTQIRPPRARKHEPRERAAARGSDGKSNLPRPRAEASFLIGEKPSAASDWVETVQPWSSRLLIGTAVENHFSFRVGIGHSVRGIVFFDGGHKFSWNIIVTQARKVKDRRN